MPTFFRFLALLAFKIFAGEKVWCVSFYLLPSDILPLQKCYEHQCLNIAFNLIFHSGRCCYFRGWVRRKVWCNKCGMHNLYLMNLTLCCTSSSLCKEYLPLMHF
jgi:hypothetical protein